MPGAVPFYYRGELVSYVASATPLTLLALHGQVGLTPANARGHRDVQRVVGLATPRATAGSHRVSAPVDPAAGPASESLPSNPTVCPAATPSVA